MKERNLHQQVRVVYRACRRIYGKEKTQDECLKVFKVVYPELLRLKTSMEERETLDAGIRPAIEAIFKAWNPTKRLKELCERVDKLIGLPFDYGRQELIDLLEDITPVAMRIRKLTPRECFRLMGVADKDFDVLVSAAKDDVSRALSNSALYKLAGNSIVAGGNNVDSKDNVDGVLYNIFYKMFIDTKEDLVKGQQLTLF